MSYINKIRDRLSIRSVGKGSSTSVSDTSKDIPLDHQLTFRRDADEEWKYKDGRIFVNDVDVEEIIDYEQRDVRLWCGISEALMEYRDDVRNRNGKNRNRSRFFARVDAVQDKVLYNMKRLYDEKTDGFFLSLGDGELLFNNFNVRAFLAMYHLKPTTKARKFLLGLKSNLALILVNRNGTPQYERVHGVIQRLYEEVISALDIPPIETRRIASHYRDRSKSA